MNSQLAGDKAELRRRLLAARHVLGPAERAAAGRSIRDAVLDLPETQMAGTVAAYYSIGAEPDTDGLLFALWKRGAYVLLPVLLPDGDLDWASYEGPDSLRPGLRGLMEPSAPARGVAAVCSADLVLVPALAVDQSGLRLGRGVGRTTARWPGSVRRCPRLRCCMTRSWFPWSRPGRMTSGSGWWPGRRPE